MVERAGAVTIGRLRARVPGEGTGIGPVGLRLRLDHLLGSADLRPPGLPPSAVLIVRRLVATSPLDLGGVPAGARLGPGWERSVRTRLADLAGAAARPDRGPVPADAAAVRFDGEAELLACLALDLITGRATERWWWRGIVPALPASGPAGLRTLLCGRPAAVPAALELLARRGGAVSIVRALPPGDAAAVLGSVLAAHGIAPSGGSGPIPMAGPIQSGERQRSADANATAPERSDGFRSSRHSAPWAAWWPDGSSIAALGKEQACLLGVALGLRLRPATVRTEAFWAAVWDWWETADGASADSGNDLTSASGTEPNRGMASGAAPQSTASPLPLKRVDMSAAPEAGSALTHASRGETQDDDLAVATDTSEIRAEWNPVAAGDAGTQMAAGRAAATTSSELGPSPSPASATRFRSTVRPQDEPVAASIRAPALAPASRLDFSGGVETRLGGLLYLLNLQERLELPDCFEEDWALATEVGTFGLLDAIGRGLLAGGATGSTGFRRDPIWMVLAELAGRMPGEPLGAGCRDAETYRVPSSWLAQVGDRDGGEFAWAVAAGRLRLWSGHGYLLLNCEADSESPATQARSALVDLGVDAVPRRRRQIEAPVARLAGPFDRVFESGERPVWWRDPGLKPRAKHDEALPGLRTDGVRRHDGLRGHTLIQGIPPNLGRWLGYALPYLRLRLLLALDPAGTSRTDPVAALLRQHARIYVNATNVDLVMDVSAVSLPARLAGLDRDPGWPRGSSRAVRFHFEGGEG